MAVFSSLIPITPKLIASRVLFRRMSDHRVLPIQPSRYQWQKFKDHLHFYTLLGLIPCGLGLLYVNVFIGPATLSETPEGYVPKHWEYERHPASRFIARYIMPSSQQEYEKYLSFIFIEHEKTKLRKLDRSILDKIAERNDYQIYYYRPAISKYHRATRELSDKLEQMQGE